MRAQIMLSYLHALIFHICLIKFAFVAFYCPLWAKFRSYPQQHIVHGLPLVPVTKELPDLASCFFVPIPESPLSERMIKQRLRANYTEHATTKPVLNSGPHSRALLSFKMTLNRWNPIKRRIMIIAMVCSETHAFDGRTKGLARIFFSLSSPLRSKNEVCN